MRCLELSIPPLPQLVTAGHANWAPGMQHFRRRFQVFDMLIIQKGTFYITEDEQEYSVNEGELLILEPGLTHFGHRPVDSLTEIYWVHYVHPETHRVIESDHIPWSSVLKAGTDSDLVPPQQSMYLPKHAKVETALLTPLLDQIVQVHQSLTLRNALRLHALSGELLERLQSVASANLNSRAYQLCERVIQYLQKHMLRPFDSQHMEQALHYHFDYLSRCLKQYTNMSPLQYMHHLQIERAQVLLRQSELSIQEIAEQVGQPNVNYFVRLFRKQIGLPPGKYRSSNKEFL
jgi:AraC-like DNA-binding protein